MTEEKTGIDGKSRVTSLRKLLVAVPERLVQLLLKLMSRKGLVFITVTYLLTKGIVREDIWFMTVTVIILNTEGVKVAELYRNR